MDQRRKAMKTLREDMLSKAEEVADSLGFRVTGGIEVCGAGDCLWEVFLDQLCQRDVLRDILHGREMSIQDLRNNVVDGLSRCEYAKMFNGNGKNDAQWVDYLQPLRQPQYYEGDIGDLALPGLAHQFGVNILLLHTSQHLGQRPYTIIPANCYGGQEITPFPVIMAYNGGHMESVIPQTNEDLNQTVNIINQNISEPVLEQNQESCQVTEEDSEDNDNFTLPTPPYVPLATHKENNHAKNDENELSNSEFEIKILTWL